jgi:protoheme IX farnesyltransferase
MKGIVAHRHVGIGWRPYLALCKPKVVALILFTALVGMMLASPDGESLPRAAFGFIGIGLAAAAGAALNQVFERGSDALMKRTQWRPLVTGEIESDRAFAFAIALTVTSMLILFQFVNALTALLTFISLIGYAVVYTMWLKPSTPQNIVLGGAAGAAPPVLGWTAITGELAQEALLLFLIIFVWTPPHFWALAIRRRAEYAKAGIPMLPVTHGVRVTKLQILLYTILLVAVTALPFVTAMSGLIYLAGALALGVGFLYYAIALYRSEGDALAMKTFGYSIFYLSALFGFLLLDHYARVFIRHFFL